MIDQENAPDGENGTQLFERSKHPQAPGRVSPRPRVPLSPVLFKIYRPLSRYQFALTKKRKIKKFGSPNGNAFAAKTQGKCDRTSYV